MEDIYQRIWDADQSENGVKPILSNESRNEDEGYIVVNNSVQDNDPDFKLLSEVKIPDSKYHTYGICKKLFDNYALAEKDEEFDTALEREEVHVLVNAMADTAPMQVARDYLTQQTGTGFTKERMYNTLMEMWFRQFSMGGDPDLTGFEHVVVGEQQGGKVQGYHFWYKYYLDDGFAREVDGIHAGAFPNLDSDRIQYLGSRTTGNQKQYPESVTMSFKWQAPDYDRQAMRPLTKPIGGFFVGCSVEGLLALGTIRAHKGIQAPRKAIINDAEYDLKLYHSNSGYQVRTFYPKFLRGLNPHEGNGGNGGGSQIVASSVRIIAALINPEGADPGKETVTIMNIGANNVQTQNWKITDKNKNSSPIGIDTLEAGLTYQISLDGTGAQLGNRGGFIHLENGAGKIVHLVSYSKSQVREQGRTILF